MKSVTRFMRRALYGSATILMYHRICELDNDPFQLCVAPENFERQLEFLCKHKKAVSVAQLLRMIRNKERLTDVVAITFDDGYLDNYEVALPLLERYQIPATFFVVTGMINSNEEFWWDQLERIFFAKSELPDNLILNISDVTMEWKLTQEPGITRNVARRTVFENIYPRIAELSPMERAIVMFELRNWSGITEIARDTHQIMGYRELIKIDQKGPFDVCAHTVSHPVLTELGKSDLYSELVDSKESLNKIFGKGRLSAMSFPHGKFNRATLQAVKDVGYEFCCTSIQDRAYAYTSSFLLPRMVVPNCDITNFRNWYCQRNRQ